MLRESDICGICGKRFRVGQTVNITLLGDRTQEGERDHIYVHIKCAIPYHEKEKKKKEDVARLAEKISRLDYLASAVRGKAPNSINNRAITPAKTGGAFSRRHISLIKMRKLASARHPWSLIPP